jgi:hypothetical protein
MIIFRNQTISEIHFPKKEYSKLIKHCLRKLNCQFLPKEVKEQQAYGFIGAKIFRTVLLIDMVVPLYQNFRKTGMVKEYMDDLVSKHAIISETPIGERGWVADPSETKNVLKIFQQNNLQLAGAYHMHHLISWKGDEPRDKPTDFDRVLGKDTELLMFIVGIVDQKKPIVRAFYEGNLSQEVQIREI